MQSMKRVNNQALILLEDRLNRLMHTTGTMQYDTRFNSIPIEKILASQAVSETLRNAYRITSKQISDITDPIDWDTIHWVPNPDPTSKIKMIPTQPIYSLKEGYLRSVVRRSNNMEDKDAETLAQGQRDLTIVQNTMAYLISYLTAHTQPSGAEQIAVKEKTQEFFQTRPLDSVSAQDRSLLQQHILNRFNFFFKGRLERIDPVFFE